jgi:mono/diheme cytochrome c family protein
MSVKGSQPLRKRLLLAGLVFAFVLAGCAHRTPTSKADARAEQALAPAAGQARPLAANAGKDLFVARCGSCHDEGGDKPLRTGPPLNQRKLSPEVIAEAVNSRLKSRTEAEREAVINYISGLYVGEK